MNQHEIKLAWVTSNYEFYAIFEPLVDKKSVVIAQVNKLLKYIKQNEEKLFITANHSFWKQGSHDRENNSKFDYQTSD